MPTWLSPRKCFLVPDVEAPAVWLRFLPAQFHRDGVTWQHVLARTIAGRDSAPPSPRSRESSARYTVSA